MQLHRRLISLTGKSVTEIINVIRLTRASELLLDKDLRVSEIGYEVGFSDPSYFSKCFKGQFGKSPTQYGIDRKQLLS